MTDHLRTDDSRFENLPGYPWAPNYATVGDDLRMHYLDEGPHGGETVLCLHGQPTWSYLYRHMIPILADAGYRVVAPDMVGFGRSDKLPRQEDYTYARHVGWMGALVQALQLTNVTLVGQDWGGLIGLRVATLMPDRFARILLSNTALPDAPGQKPEDAAPMREAFEKVPALPVLEMGAKMAADRSRAVVEAPGFMYWIKHCRDFPDFSASSVLAMSMARNPGKTLTEDEMRAYDAPFPSEEYLKGARRFPSLVPIFPDDPAIADNRAAWDVLRKWQKPLRTAFTDSDPVSAGQDKRFQDEVPGAQGQAHVTIEGAGHFVQEEAPEALAGAVIDFCRDNPIVAGRG